VLRSISEQGANQFNTTANDNELFFISCALARLLRGGFDVLVMRKDRERRIEEVKSQTECDIGFARCKSGSVNPCCAKIISGAGLMDCSNCGCPRAEKCNNRAPFGFGHFCSCPLRIFASVNSGDSPTH
jgi:hypothetical protein